MKVAEIRTTQEQGHEYKSLWFLCPGCDNTLHALPISGDIPSGRPRWDFTGTEESPTLSPSILTKMTRPDGEFVCHSFMRDGKMEFLTDSTHQYAGQTIPLPEYSREPLGGTDDTDGD